jgi:Fe-S oxidoreductase
MVEEARVKAMEVVDSLLPFAEKGIAIVGLEPSCLLTLRDEMLAMGLGPPAEAIAAHALLLEEFLARESQAGRLEALKAKLRPLDKRVLLHGHCHQKAFAAVAPIVEVLRLDLGAAGSDRKQLLRHGRQLRYEAGHYEISMQMGRVEPAAGGA